MPKPRINFGAIYYNGKIYCVGGWMNAYTQYCDEFIIEKDIWEKSTPL